MQKDRLTAYCKSQGWEEFRLYVDDGYTGTKLDRPAMNRMIKHIEEKQHDLVLVYKLDRLSRKQKDVLYLLEDVFEKNGVAFRSSSEPFDTTTAFGKATIGMLAVFAQLERDMIVERTTSGRRQRAMEGTWYGGRIPFGYSWDKKAKSLDIIDDEAYFVKQMFKRYLQGQSRMAIAEWMAESTNARMFDHNVIRDMLCRPIYNGKLINVGSIVEGKHKKIIDDETWFAVQKEIAKRKEGLPAVGEYLLTGLLQCGVCNGTVVHVRRRTGIHIYELYACKNQHVRRKDRTNHCTMGYIRREQLEKKVIDEIKTITTNPKRVHDIIKKEKHQSPDLSLLTALKEKVVKIDSGLENLYEAIQTGTVKISAVGGRINKLEEERVSTVKQLEDLEDVTPVFKESHQVYALIRQIGEAWDYFTEEEQKITIRKIVNKIVLKKGNDPIIYWNTTE